MSSSLNLPAWSRVTASRTKLSGRQEARGETGGRKPSHTVRCFPSSGFLHFRQDDQFSGRLLMRKYTVHMCGCVYVCICVCHAYTRKALSSSAWYPRRRRICTCSTCPPYDRFIRPNNGEFHWFGGIALLKKKHTQHTFSLRSEKQNISSICRRGPPCDHSIYHFFPTRAPRMGVLNVPCARACKRAYLKCYSHNRLQYPREMIHPDVLLNMKVIRFTGDLCLGPAFIFFYSIIPHTPDRKDDLHGVHLHVLKCTLQMKPKTETKQESWMWKKQLKIQKGEQYIKRNIKKEPRNQNSQLGPIASKQPTEPNLPM